MIKYVILFFSLGKDLEKIREGTAEQVLTYEEEHNFDNQDDENQEQIDAEFLEMHELVPTTNGDNSLFLSKLDQMYQEFYHILQQCWQSLPNEYLCLMSIFTFTIFTVFIANLLIEVEYTRKLDAGPFKWDEIFGPFTRA